MEKELTNKERYIESITSMKKLTDERVGTFDERRAKEQSILLCDIAYSLANIADTLEKILKGEKK